MTQTAREYATQHHDRFYDQLKTLIRIPSVSTEPARAHRVREAADWLVADMQQIGLDRVELIERPEGRHPLLLGEWRGAGESAPTVLIYGHYDVQPAELEDGWHSEPFEPTERDGKLYARGATDSKVNVMSQLKAVESLLASAESCPVNLKLIFEGEEESGSETINAFVAEHGGRLRSDVAVICDGGIVHPDQPSMVVGLRGIVTMELRVNGPVRDLHSGHFGGNVHNPAQALTEILAQLHDVDGKVTVPGFYDAVDELSAADRARLAAADPWFDENWHDTAAAPQPWGEPDYSIHERAGIRPTLEINGIWGGYAGPGVKTVLPAHAGAKLSCRLVASQDPKRIYQLVAEHIEAITPPTVTVELIEFDMGSPAVRLPFESAAITNASAAYEQAWGAAPVYEVAGGSVPIASTFQHLADEMVMMGFAHKGGQAHGPNEHIYIKNFRRSVAAAIRFLQLTGSV